LKPGFIYEYRIDAGVTSSVFLKGHRIRIEISSSNFPRFDRNPNTGRPIAAETELRTAAQTIYHDRAHESYVLLPVVRDWKKLENGADQLKHTLSHQQARPGDPGTQPGNLKSYK
jgi:hypothetical protein